MKVYVGKLIFSITLTLLCRLKSEKKKKANQQLTRLYFPIWPDCSLLPCFFLSVVTLVFILRPCSFSLSPPVLFYNIVTINKTRRLQQQLLPYFPILVCEDKTIGHPKEGALFRINLPTATSGQYSLRIQQSNSGIYGDQLQLSRT